MRRDVFGGGRVTGGTGHGGCRRRAHDERGQVVVLFALLLPMLLAFGVIVLDIGNWYVHKRHLSDDGRRRSVRRRDQVRGLLVPVRRSCRGKSRQSRPRLYAGVTYRSDDTQQASRARTTRRSVLTAIASDPRPNQAQWWRRYLRQRQTISRCTAGAGPAARRSLDVKATERRRPVRSGPPAALPGHQEQGARRDTSRSRRRPGCCRWAVPTSAAGCRRGDLRRREHRKRHPRRLSRCVGCMTSTSPGLCRRVLPLGPDDEPS